MASLKRAIGLCPSLRFMNGQRRAYTVLKPSFLARFLLFREMVTVNLVTNKDETMNETMKKFDERIRVSRMDTQAGVLTILESTMNMTHFEKVIGFDVNEFLEGVQVAYDVVSESINARDIDSIRSMLTKECEEHLGIIMDIIKLQKESHKIVGREADVLISKFSVYPIVEGESSEDSEDYIKWMDKFLRPKRAQIEVHTSVFGKEKMEVRNENQEVIKEFEGNFSTKLIFRAIYGDDPFEWKVHKITQR